MAYAVKVKLKLQDSGKAVGFKYHY